jgi:hypothetical protein
MFVLKQTGELLQLHGQQDISEFFVFALWRALSPTNFEAFPEPGNCHTTIALQPLDRRCEAFAMRLLSQPRLYDAAFRCPSNPTNRR